MNANIFDKCKPARVYLNQVGSKTFVHFKQGRIEVISEDKTVELAVEDHMKKHGSDKANIKNVNSLFSFIKNIPELFSSTSNVTQLRPLKTQFKSNMYEGLKNTKSIFELSAETKGQDLSTIKFKQHTIDNAYILVDTREPEALLTLMYGCQIQSVDAAQLELGDVLVGFKDEPVELIIERKTISDANKSITGDDHRAHSQIERLYQYTQEKAALGVHVKVIWIFENEDNQTLYNCLNLAKQVDGWVNFSIAISDQYIATSYNIVHTAYLICKFAQGFLERKLTYPVKINGSRIDTAKHHKLRKELKVDNGDRGVSLPQASIAATLSGMPNIPSNVAKELAKTGKSLKEIFSMSIEEILSIKGVGAKRGEKIYSTFNDIY